MGSLLLDLRQAARVLAKAPTFTAVTVATLALGIGANTAIFSLVDAVLLRPLGFAAAERLVTIHEGIPEAELPKLPMSAPDLLDLQGYQRSFDGVAAFRNQEVEVSGGGEPERLTAARVSASLLPLLGTSPARGRAFTAAEDAPGQDVAILSDRLWRRRFGGNLSAVGGKILIDRRPYTVVGVMPRDFEFPRRGMTYNGQPAEVFLPIAFTPPERRARGMMFNNSVVARLRPGVALAAAQAELDLLAGRIRDNYPAELKSSPYHLLLKATPLREEISGAVERPLLILLGAVGLVLLVACANVANLVLSHAASRRREIGMRAALGAGRRRLFQMMAAESLLLAAAGGALGLALGQWALAAMPRVVAEGLPGVARVALDGRVLAFAAALSAATALAFGVLPLVGLTRNGRRGLGSLYGALAGGRSTSEPARHRVQGALVVSTVGLACVLLAGAGLLVRSFANLLASDPGFRPQRVLTMVASLPPEGYPTAASIRTFQGEAARRLAALPGVRAASLSSDLPTVLDGERRAFTPEGTPAAAGVPPSLALTWVHGDYFGTFGIAVERGRAFTAQEMEENRRVVMVSESIARQFWPGQDPIGKRLKWGIAASEAPWLTIVGVVADVTEGALGTAPSLHAYEPYGQVRDEALADTVTGLWRRIHVAVLAPGDPAALAGQVRAEISRLDPALAVAGVATMEQRLADTVAPQRFSTLLLGAFAAGALLLAAIGLYGVLAAAVAQRTREIGVRMALGAAPGRVLGLVVRQGMTLVGAGLLLGLAAALALTRVMASLLYGTTPRDPWAFAAGPVVLAVVAAVACWLPARRAAGVDPVVALRQE
jgi:putative ABC transport system permease protein